MAASGQIHATSNLSVRLIRVTHGRATALITMSRMSQARRSGAGCRAPAPHGDGVTIHGRIGELGDGAKRIRRRCKLHLARAALPGSDAL